MSSHIRLAKVSDLDKLLKLLFQLSAKKEEDDKVSKEYLKKTLAKILRNKNYFVAVYEQDKRLLGTATLLIQLNLSHGGRSYGHIENVVTDASQRGKGIGKELIDYLVNEAKKMNSYKVILDCSESNFPFYEKCGFRKTGEIELRIDL